MIWLKLIMAFIVLILTMLMFGSVITRKEDTILEKLIVGFLTLLGVIQIIAIPMIFLYCRFNKLKIAVLLAICACLLLFGYMCITKKLQIGISDKRAFAKLKTISQKEKILFAVLVLLIIGQLGYTLLFTHTDMDDAFYVVTAVDTVNTDTMYQIDPNTGEALNAFPVRYVLSPFPMVYALIGSLFKVSPTIIAHILIPLIVIPLCYVTTYLLSRRLLGEEREKVFFMTIIVAILMMFQGATSYSTGSFLLLRSWQGKSILATVIIPFVIYLFLGYKDYKEKKTEFWMKLLVVLIAGANVSSMGIMLTPIAVVVMGFITALMERKWKPIIGSILCCIPSGIYALMYVKLYAWQLF